MFLMRVTLPGPPRFVGLRCDGDGSVDADINAVEIVEKKFDGSVVDAYRSAAQPVTRDYRDCLPESAWRTRGVDCALSGGRRAAIGPGGIGANDG